MSGFAYPALKTYCALVKEINPEIFIFAGGQHVSPLGSIALDEIQHLDCVVRYEGEGTTLELYDAVVNQLRTLESVPGIVFRSGAKIVSTPDTGTQLPLEELAYLNYEMFPNFQNLVPRLEESRGCPFDCSFCSNASVFTYKVRYKAADRLIGELNWIYRQYGNPQVLRFYLIAKNYGLNRNITEEFAKSVRRLPFKFQWRTQTRADMIDPDLIPTLSAGGLRVLDLGLESASPKMLRLMNKTDDPKDYLTKAEAVFEVVGKLPETKLKINLVFHPGETSETLGETLEFLFRWRAKIDAVTAAPAMVDPGAPLWHKMPFFEQNYGSRLIKNEFWDAIHTHPVHPSDELSFEQCNMLANLVSKMFQTKESYFETRLFGGMLRSTDLQKFDAKMRGVSTALQPYRKFGGHAVE